MNDRCATEPLQLPDGTTLQPDEPITLQKLCEIFPIMFEIEAEKIQAQQSQAKPGVRAGGPLNMAPSNAPAGFQSPGQISPFGSPGGGPSSGAGSGGGGGPIPGGGGSGRRRVVQGTQGPPGPPGPAGPGGLSPGKIKVDGDFAVASPNSPWTPVPGTDFAFTQSADGSAYFFIQAVFGTTGIACCDVSGQIGLRIDGVDYPLTLDYFNTFVAGVGPIASPGPAFWPATMLAGDHTVEVVIRGINQVATGLSQNTPLIVLANPIVPLAVGVIHG